MSPLLRPFAVALLLCLAPTSNSQPYNSQSAAPGKPTAPRSVVPALTLPPANLVYGTTRYFNQLIRPGNFVVADINGDGVLDLIAPQFGASNIAISLGDPAHPGTFLAPTFVPTSSPTVDSVTVADLNGDGLPDLVYGDGDSQFAGVLLQNSASPGTFLPSYYVGATQAQPLVADMNHDGVPDLVLFPSNAGLYTSSSVAVLLGDPAHRGSFLAPTLFSLGSGGIVCAAVADMDLDGLPDIVIGNFEAKTVSVFINDSTHPGSLLARRDYPVAGSVTSVALGDLDGDRYPDVVLGGFFDGVGVFLGNPLHPGTLLPMSTYSVTPTPAGKSSGQVALGDINGDGKLDVIAGRSGPLFDLLLGNGDGSLAPPTPYSTGPTPDTFEGGPVAADVDGDGLQDVLIGQFYQNSVQTFVHRPTMPSLAITATDQSFSSDVVNPGSPLTITVKVSAFQGTPQGPVILYDSGGGATFIPLATLSLDSTGTAVYTTTSLQPIFHDFITHFPGDGTYAPSTSLIQTVIVTSNPTVSITLAGSPNPGILGQIVILTATITASNPAPTGNVVFLDSGTMIGSAPLNASGVAVFNTSSLILGVHSLKAVYPGDEHYVSQQATTTEVIRYPSAQLTLTSSLNPAPFGQSITFQTKAAATGPAPTGSVSFQDNGVTQLQVPLAADGTAIFTTASLAVGSHLVQATYSGDGNYAAQSATLTQIVVAPAPPPPPAPPGVPGDYTLTVGGSLTLGTVHAGAVALSATSLNGLADTVALSCGSLPAYVTCRIIPVTLTIDNGAPRQAVIQIAIDQSPANAALRTDGGTFLAASIPFLCLALPFGGRLWLRLALSLFVISLLPTIAGCGFSRSLLSTPPGTYSIAIQGHGASSNLDRSTTLTLIVE